MIYRAKERRRMILDALAVDGAMTCAELAVATEQNRMTVWHHLCVLLDRGRIYRSEGPPILYSIHPPLPRRSLAEIYDSLAS